MTPPQKLCRAIAGALSSIFLIPQKHSVAVLVVVVVVVAVLHAVSPSPRSLSRSASLQAEVAVPTGAERSAGGSESSDDGSGCLEPMDGRETFYLKWLSPPSRRRASRLVREPDVEGPCGLGDWTTGASLVSGLTSRGQPGVSQAPAFASFVTASTQLLMMPIRWRPGWRTRRPLKSCCSSSRPQTTGIKFMDV